MLLLNLNSPESNNKSKFYIEKKTGSTYNSHFNTIEERREKSKSVLSGPVLRYPNKSAVKELARFYRAKQSFEDDNQNYTIDNIKLNAMKNGTKAKL